MVNGMGTGFAGGGNGRGPLGWIRRHWGDHAPVVTIAITLICIVAWVIQMALYLLAPLRYQRLLLGYWAFVPITAIHEPWMFVTNIFLHATNVSHILFNMITLWVVGPVLENLIGHGRFLALYLISGLGGDLGLMVYAVLAPNGWGTSAIGASGALFGLFAAILVVYRRLGIDIVSMVVWMAINFCMPLFVSGIAWQDHVGGFIVGGLFMLALLHMGRPGSRVHGLLSWLLPTLIFLAALVLLALGCNMANPMR